MAEYIEREKALAFQNELEPCLCRSAATGEVFSATKDADLVAYLQSIPAVNVREVVLCGECVLSGHCWCEDVFKFTRLSDKNRFCGVGKRASNAEKDGGDGNG